jgi:hypothetical protein
LHNITDCINLAEFFLRKEKSHTKADNRSPRFDRSGDIFSGLNHIDDKIAQCIKLVEDTLRNGSFKKQEEVRS